MLTSAVIMRLLFAVLGHEKHLIRMTKSEKRRLFRMKVGFRLLAACPSLVGALFKHDLGAILSYTGAMHTSAITTCFLHLLVHMPALPGSPASSHAGRGACVACAPNSRLRHTFSRMLLVHAIWRKHMVLAETYALHNNTSARYCIVFLFNCECWSCVAGFDVYPAVFAHIHFERPCYL